MRIFVLLVILLQVQPGGDLHGQSFFNILPDAGGLDMQGVCRLIIPSDTSFIVIGHRYDTTGEGSVEKPWLGELDYDGHMKFLMPLTDTLHTTPFYAEVLLYAHKAGDHYYVCALRSVGGPYRMLYLFELNIRSGEIIRSVILPNLQYPNKLQATTAISFDGGVITLASFAQLNDTVKTYITVLDTLFNYLDFVEVDNIYKVQIPDFIYVNSDSSYSVIGFTRVKEYMFYAEVTIYYHHIGRDGQLIGARLSPTTFSISNSLSQAQNIYRRENGDWIIAGHHSIYYPDSCIFCVVYIPYLISASADFDSLLWETRFFDIPHRIGDYYYVYSIAEVDDGYIVSGAFRNHDLDDFPDSGILFKAALNGDSLWMKHYIPLEWDGYRVVWAKLPEIRVTPFGSIIAAGEVADRDLQIIRPWILHLDKDGCLVPGCNTTTSAKDVTAPGSDQKFRLHPNPAASELFLLYQGASFEAFSMRLVSSGGQVIRARRLQALENAQYVLSVSELASGIYYLVMENEKTGMVESHRFVKL